MLTQEIGKSQQHCCDNVRLVHETAVPKNGSVSIRFHRKLIESLFYQFIAKRNSFRVEILMVFENCSPIEIKSKI